MQRVSLEFFEKILPLELIQKLAVEHNADKCNQIRLPGTAVFSSLLETSLWGCDTSQRALADAYFKKTGQTADHSSFGKRLSTIPVAFFRDIFEHLFQVLSPEATPSEKKALRLRYVDATVVTLSSRLINFGLLINQQKSKFPVRNIKTVFSLNEHGLPRMMRLCESRSELSDNVALGDPILASLQANDLCVFDAGMNDRSRFLAINNANAYFLTRHSSQTLSIQNVIFEPRQEDITDDAPKKGEQTYQLVRVEECRFGSVNGANKYLNLPVITIHGRRWDARSQKWSPLVLMTNMPLTDNNAKVGPYSFLEVAELYRSRWDIELFFKFIKQNLGYSHIVSRTQNGIEVMIYMTLIATLLMIWYKRLSGIKEGGWPSVKRWISFDSTLWTTELMERAIWVQRSAQKNRPKRI